MSITALSGSGQSTASGSNYSNPLRAKVLAANSQPLQGLDVTFAAPASAPSVTFAGGGKVAHALTDATGVATSPMMTADATVGSFQVTATAGGGVIATPANFDLTTRSVTPGSITVSNGAVGKYLQSTITVTLSAPAGPAGVPVTLTSSDPSKLLLDGTGNGIVTAPVPSGETQLTIAVYALAGTGSATVTAKAPGYTDGHGVITLGLSGFVLAGPNGVGVSFQTFNHVATKLTVFPPSLILMGAFVEQQALGKPPSPVSVTITSTGAGSVTPSSGFPPAIANRT